MTRVKEFNVEEVLDKALAVFWERGYEGTSMRELQQRMGIGKQSMYDTFGDKRQLFLAVMQRYDDMSEGDPNKPRVEILGGLGYLENFFAGLIENVAQNCGKSGCFLINTMQEFGEKDLDVSKLTRAVDERIRKRFTQALDFGREKGEFSADLDTWDTVDFLVAQTYGLSVMAKNGTERPALENVVSLALGSLRPKN